MTYFIEKKKELNRVFGSLGWELLESGGGLLRDSAAYIDVQLDHLKIRLVHDRSRERIEVECQKQGQSEWIGLDILAVAVRGKSLDEYRKASEATVANWDSVMPSEVQMIDEPLEFIRDFSEDLGKVAQDESRLLETEISAKTRSNLESTR